MQIMLMEGDGIGPEIIESAYKILTTLNENFNVKIDSVRYDIGARTVASGKWNIDRIIQESQQYKAMLKAPMGDPSLVSGSGTELALDIILGLRFHFDLFANVRPVRLLPGVNSVLKGFDESRTINYTLVRENSEGLYSSHFGGLVLRDSIAIDNQIISSEGTERVSKFAYELARKSNGSPSDGRKRVMCVDKANVLKTFAFFRKVLSKVSRDYPDIDTQYMYGDAMAQYMLFNPDKLNVVVTENMFGDILSDLGAATVGGLGFASSANLSLERGMFEPVHGSAVDIAGKGIANPTAMILSTAMMIDWLGYSNYRNMVEQALFSVLSRGIRTTDMGGKDSTRKITESIIEELVKN
jgi:3-isopropylmalate dehydrogenase